VREPISLSEVDSEQGKRLTGPPRRRPAEHAEAVRVDPTMSQSDDVAVLELLDPPVELASAALQHDDGYSGAGEFGCQRQPSRPPANDTDIRRDPCVPAAVEIRDQGRSIKG
jgi:hypothetical protein